MAVARVFPRKTNASPVDELAFFDEPGMFLPEIDEAHVSVAFAEDIPKAEHLAKAWNRVAPATIGGPAMNAAGGAFVAGMYLRTGYVITSRGCPNRCWFCKVPQREGNTIRELPIVDGWNVLDDNLLACSESHIRNVFAMLARQSQRPMFTGGLEAAKLQPWHVDLLAGIKPQRLYCAYDTPDDYEPLVRAGRMLLDAGFTVASHVLCAYVLIGYPNDTYLLAEQRLMKTIDAGFVPYAMLYRDGKHEPDIDWRKFTRLWSRPAIIAARGLLRQGY